MAYDSNRKVINLREKLIRFMTGRYGLDSLGKCILVIAIIISLLAPFFRSELMNLLAWALLIYTYFRIFSKNIYKRYAENQAYLVKTAKIRHLFTKQKNMMKQRKTHHIYKCPTCKQKIRIPKGKGKIEIRCPKCYTTFIKNS